MPRGRWKPSEDLIAQEAHRVLVLGAKPTRTYSKAVLIERLSKPAVSTDFLKACLEFDDTKNLAQFRKGLLFVAKARGASSSAKSTGVSRVTLYRMLSKNGNPTLASLLGLFRHLGLNLWLVEMDFIARRSLAPRPKDGSTVPGLTTAKARHLFHNTSLGL